MGTLIVTNNESCCYVVSILSTRSNYQHINIYILPHIYLILQSHLFHMHSFNLSNNITVRKPTILHVYQTFYMLLSFVILILAHSFAEQICVSSCRSQVH